MPHDARRCASLGASHHRYRHWRRSHIVTARSPRATSQPAWAAGARRTGRPPSSAGWRSSSPPFRRSARSARRTSTAEERAGESGRVDRSLADEFKQPTGEMVLVQSKTLDVTDPAFRPRSRTSQRRRRGSDRDQRPLAARRRLRGQISADRHSALVQFELRGTDRQGDRRSSRSRPPSRRSRPAPALSVERVRRREREQGARRRLQPRPEEGRRAVARRSRSRSCSSPSARSSPRAPAAARADRRLHDDGPDRAAEPPDPARREHLGRDPARRPRRRRRLRDVLLEARARGACRRQRPTQRSRPRRPRRAAP